ncbi:unnamed protein product [Prorocentrum cordatum]|uniref:Ion transport domain-containing protein n=1 Tax=Prorocentrum cordatum TaxID=2364126 RepID=A0ABN9TI11_9DINO|nr:unnamed protein product [Polarella glacialis]
MQAQLIASTLAEDGLDAREAKDRRKLAQNIGKWKRRRSLMKIVSSPILPTRDVVKDAIFFKKLFFYAEKCGYLQHREGEQVLHIVTFRRFLRRYYFFLGIDFDSQVEWSSGVHKLPTWIKWEDIQRALDTEDFHEESLEISLQRSCFERLNAVLDDSDSIMGNLWTAFVMSCILVSLASIVVGEDSFPPYTDEFCIIVFSIEYVLKLLCAGCCRRILNSDESMWAEIVPSQDPNEPLVPEETPTVKILSYVCSPVNLVDLFAILPFWLRVIFSTTKMNLSFLRSVRILRVLRIMKFGSFTKDFKLMGAVFAKSTGAIVAIALTLSMLSILFGAVMAQFEGELIERNLDGAIWESNEKWHDMVDPDGDGHDDIPRTMLWVAGRMTNMQASMRDKKVIPASWPNQVIVHILGIMKGFVFLLPLGQMQQFFRSQAQSAKDLDELEYQVEEELHIKVGQHWTSAHTVPFALVEVFPAEERIGIGGAEPPRGVGSGILNLPLSEGRSEDPSVVLCPITGLQACGVIPDPDAFPSIFFEVMWASEQDGRHIKRADGFVEDGVLTIRVVSGINFPSESSGWKLRVSVPEHLFGRGAKASRYTCASVNTPEEPFWDIHLQFNVDWGRRCDTPRHGSPKRKPRQDSQSISQLEECMKEQLATLSRIEEAVQDKLKMRQEKVQAAELRVGAAIVVVSPSGAKRECTIVDFQGDQVKIHYNGFDQVNDEWLTQFSDRILDGRPPGSARWLVPDPAPAPGSGESFLPPIPEPAPVL